MKIVLTGGGSAGHVIPNLALLNPLRALGYEVHYLGSQEGIEKDIIEREDIPYHGIPSGKLRRYKDLKNITDLFKISGGFFKSISLLKKIKPLVLFSKGGYVSCPVVWAAWLCRIPVILHESDLTPGLANKLSVPFAQKICYTFPETKEFLNDEKSVLTGIPIRENLLTGNREKGLALCNFNWEKPIVLVIGGSLGSKGINEAIRRSLTRLLSEFQVCHICGPGNMDKSQQQKGYAQFEYVHEDLSHLFAAADLVISRAGATILFEILALRKPNLLIPLPLTASRGDQIQNAESFAKQGFSKVLNEEDFAKTDILSFIRDLYGKREEYKANMDKSEALSAADKIISLINEVKKTKK